MSTIQCVLFCKRTLKSELNVPTYLIYHKRFGQVVSYTHLLYVRYIPETHKHVARSQRPAPPRGDCIKRLHSECFVTALFIIQFSNDNRSIANQKLYFLPKLVIETRRILVILCWQSVWRVASYLIDGASWRQRLLKDNKAGAVTCQANNRDKLPPSKSSAFSYLCPNVTVVCPSGPPRHPARQGGSRARSVRCM